MFEERCNCENLNCEHGEEPCSNRAHSSGAYRLLYVGKVCSFCYYRANPEYRVLDGGQRRKLIEMKRETD
jgi:hypothetical protein